VSKKIKSTLLRGSELIAALQFSSLPVKFASDSFQSHHILSAGQALLMVKSGVYEGSFRGGRIRFIREIDTRIPAVAQFSYWDDRAVIKYWGSHSYRDKFPVCEGKNYWPAARTPVTAAP